MITKNKYGILLVVMVHMIASSIFAQVPLVDTTNTAFEQIHLVTDRAIYAVEEKVYFKISNRESIQQSNVSWSNIVYCEIITPEGNTIANVKSLIYNNGGSGELTIPRNTLSGNYYIRAYTKWMLNQSPYSFAYKPIKILNPFTSEVLVNNGSTNDEIKFTSEKISIHDNVVWITTDSIFRTNQEVEFHIQAKNGAPIQKDVSVAVVRKGLSNAKHFYVSNASKRITEVKYIPETRGISISGKVVNRFDSLPVPFAVVWVTLLTEKPVTREALTNEQGYFYFDLGKEEGHYELNISVTANKTNVDPIIYVDNDYSTSTVKLPFVPFEIADNERELFETMAINSQLEELFHKKMKSDSLKFSFENFFYGKPDNTIKFNQFVDLPTIEDYIKELVPNVYVRREDTKPIFKIYSSLPEMGLNQPLVMVNMVKYNNAKDILKLSPKLIDRVELITVPFIRGEIMYGGIIHFITKSANYSDFNFEPGSVLIDFEMLGTKTTSSNTNITGQSLPKLGNCLYWNPSLKMEPKNSTSVSFNTGTEPGEFELVIEGLDQDAKPYQMRKSITILK